MPASVIAFLKPHSVNMFPHFGETLMRKSVRTQNDTTHMLESMLLRDGDN